MSTSPQKAAETASSREKGAFHERERERERSCEPCPQKLPCPVLHPHQPEGGRTTAEPRKKSFLLLVPGNAHFSLITRRSNVVLQKSFTPPFLILQTFRTSTADQNDRNKWKWERQWCHHRYEPSQTRPCPDAERRRDCEFNFADVTLEKSMLKSWNTAG